MMTGCFRKRALGLRELHFDARRTWQLLYFFPLPHGHGSLRPTFLSQLRIGSEELMKRLG
jgi:hypothetical protein